jgi:RHS repeat-associated protein
MAALSASVSSVSSVYQYSCLPGTDLLAGWSNSAGFAALRTFEPHRDLIASVANTFQGQPIGSFAYANDALAHRVSRTDQSALSALSVATNLFAYNARSELSSAQMGTNAYGYVYDPIGNRLSASNNAEALTYTANALNQYTSILSSAPSAPLRETSPLFDADGNLTNYNGWTFTWDAENRLITAVHRSTVVSNQYDFMSRRVAKTVGGTTHRFLYDGWAMIQEKTGTQTNSYVYGLDLSGTPQGAGTIGGMLGASLNGTQAFYFYDANGNVSDLIASNGGSLAHYEFDPYGNTIVTSGTQAAANPFRFSTKYTDDETGLVYYGYRYYSPMLGRWGNRDPIEEDGGDNLYAFVSGSPVSSIDLLGLWAITRVSQQNWAKAVPASGETFASLATQLSLDYSERMKWLKKSDGTFVDSTEEPTAPCEYKVPNTVIAYASKKTGMDAAPGNSFNVSVVLRNNALNWGQQYAAKHYFVLTIEEGDSAELFRGLWKLDGIFAYFFGGHSDRSLLGYMAAPSTRTAVNPEDVKPPYHLQAVYALACATADMHTIGSRHPGGGPMQQFGWKSLISSPGSVLGYHGRVDYNNYHQHELAVRVGNIPN